jgi:ketosteroid isomerase-like protein
MGRAYMTGIEVSAISDDFDAFVGVYRNGIRSMARGDNAPAMAVYSRRDDVTLANPLGPPIAGWDNIARESARVAAGITGGTVEFEEVTRCVMPDAAWIVGLEHGQVQRVGSDEPVAIALRVTTIFRREDGEWKVALRHADRITSKQ